MQLRTLIVIPMHSYTTHRHPIWKCPQSPKCQWLQIVIKFPFYLHIDSLHFLFLVHPLWSSSTICPQIKVQKQHENRDDISKIHHRPSREDLIASIIQNQYSVSIQHQKLGHLQRRQMLLPPNTVFGSSCRRVLHFGHMHGNEVIRVHNHVNEGIPSDAHDYFTIKVDHQIEPVQHPNRCMMVYMKHTELLWFIAQNNKQSVKPIQHFAHIIHPNQIMNFRILEIEYIAFGPWKPAIPIALSEDDGFHCHIRTQINLDEIVQEFERIEN